MDAVQGAVLQMLAAAGNDQSLLARVAGLTTAEQDFCFARPYEWGVHRRRGDLRRCLEKLDRTADPDGCWLTTGYRAPSGHATCAPKSLGTTSLSRQVYMVTSGRYDLDGLVVRHCCQGGPAGCGRPEHLVAGTVAQNRHDRVRHRRGETIPGRSTDELLHMDVLGVPARELRLLADLEHYLSRLQPLGNGCLTVDRSLRGHYRTVTLAGRRGKLHRCVLELVLGRPLEQLVLHACDRPQCCAVAHLSEGSAARNTREAVERGRLPVGAEHPRAVLRPELVTAVRRLADLDTWSTRRLSDRLGVGIWVVQRVTRFQSYSHGTGQAPRPAKVYLSARGVRTCRALAAVGLPPAMLATRTGLREEYMDDLLRHRHRRAAGGPCLPVVGPARGARVSMARLDRLKVAVARQRVTHHGDSRAAVARDLGVSPSTIERAVGGVTWHP